MNFSLSPNDFLSESSTHSDLLIVLARDGYEPAKHTSAKSLTAMVAQALKQGHWSTAVGKRLSFYQPGSACAPRIVFLGVGKGTARDLRGALHQAVKELAAGHARLAVYFAQDAEPAQISAAMQAIAKGGYVYAATKPGAKTGLQKIVLGAPNAAACKAAFMQAKGLLAGVALAREWGNLPPNHATPVLLANAAKEMVRQANQGHGVSRFTCEVLDQGKVAKLGMGAFMAVAKGSSEPLRFIVLKYQGAAKTRKPLVFVGKGITFDSGGISIKPGAGMDEMKFDMCGAASVLGLFECLRHLRPAVNVAGLIPACENMPSGGATKPGDVVTSMSGQSIEVLNTDAEGRLILCDALTYAERLHPAAVVDIATLTGNCVMALGNVRSGLFSAHDALADEIERAANDAEDLCWRMPMDDAYGKGLQSNFADMANIGGRTAGAISAAKFLEKFTSKYPWAHLDIAGTAWDEGAAKGATGRPVPLLLQFVLNMAQQPVSFALPEHAASPKAPSTPKASKKAVAARAKRA